MLHGVSWRVWLFLVLCLLGVAGVGAYFHRIVQRHPAPKPDSKLEGRAPIAEAAAPPATAKKKEAGPLPRPSSPGIYFRNTALGPDYGSLAFLRLPLSGQRPRFVAGLSCEAVHVAGGMGICLTADRGVLTTYAAVLFNERGEQLRTIPLAGVPSRCRMSPDGKTAADTIFLTGHSYSSMDFTTQTRLLDTATGAVIADLEDFAVTRDGAPFHAKDFNFWGVTFTPDSRGFYCTLSSDRKHYLVRGDMKTRTASVVHENVECPSVSPDGTRVAYKKRFAAGHRLQWQLHVLDLASSTETPLSERRSVDDQLEWLDNENVLYAVPSAESSAGADIWRADAGGQGMPGLFLPLAYSPAVIR